MHSETPRHACRRLWPRSITERSSSCMKTCWMHLCGRVRNAMLQRMHPSSMKHLNSAEGFAPTATAVTMGAQALVKQREALYALQWDPLMVVAPIVVGYRVHVTILHLKPPFLLLTLGKPHRVPANAVAMSAPRISQHRSCHSTSMHSRRRGSFLKVPCHRPSGPHLHQGTPQQPEAHHVLPRQSFQAPHQI